MLPNFVLDVRGLVAKPPDKRLVTENQRSLAFVSQFVLVSGLVRNRLSGISVPRAFPIHYRQQHEGNLEVLCSASCPTVSLP